MVYTVMRLTRKIAVYYSMKNDKKIPMFKLKQYYDRLLSEELADCGFSIVLGFESSFSARICTFKFVEDRKIEICMNLGGIKNAGLAVACSSKLQAYYCAVFVSEYIKLIRRAESEEPVNYFDGLVFLNAVEICQRRRKIRIYSPLLALEPQRKVYRFYPIEISSAIKAIKRIKVSTILLTSDEERTQIEKSIDKFQLYACLPEIAYTEDKVPVYAIMDMFKKITITVVRRPDIIERFPILCILPFEQMMYMTINDLFQFGVHANNDFLTGLVIRLIAFFQFPYEIEFERDVRERLNEALKRYVKCCLMYYKKLQNSDEPLLKDNLFAVKAAVKSINRYLSVYGIDIKSGNVHAIG